MASIPQYFYLNGKLHERLAIVRSDSSVYAFCFQDEKSWWYPLKETQRLYKKAFTIAKAAKLMNVKPGKIHELFDKKEYPWPEKSYDLSTFRPKTAFINEENMLEIRQLLWDLLPKNRYGIPYNDDMTSEDELINAMRLQDQRDYVKVDGDMIRIFRA